MRQVIRNFSAHIRNWQGRKANYDGHHNEAMSIFETIYYDESLPAELRIKACRSHKLAKVLKENVK